MVRLGRKTATYERRRRRQKRQPLGICQINHVSTPIFFSFSRQEIDKNRGLVDGCNFGIARRCFQYIIEAENGRSIS